LCYPLCRNMSHGPFTVSIKQTGERLWMYVLLPSCTFRFGRFGFIWRPPSFCFQACSACFSLCTPRKPRVLCSGPMNPLPSPSPYSLILPSVQEVSTRGPQECSPTHTRLSNCIRPCTRSFFIYPSTFNLPVLYSATVHRVQASVMNEVAGVSPRVMYRYTIQGSTPCFRRYNCTSRP
jgi:hypothetical protein